MEIDMVEMVITDEMISMAKLRREKMPGVIRNSIMGGNRTFEGCLGEVVVAIHMNAKYITTYDFDLVCKEYKIEVKTKVRSVLPKPHYEVSIANFNTKQECDYYVFVSLYCPKGKTLPEKAHIVGCYPPKQYINDAKFLKQGEIDPDNNFVVRADCWNMKISDLKNINDIT